VVALKWCGGGGATDDLGASGRHLRLKSSSSGLITTPIFGARKVPPKLQLPTVDRRG